MSDDAPPAQPDELEADWYEEVDEQLWRKKVPLTERTNTSGLFEFSAPVVGGGKLEFRWPATNRSAMVTITVFLCCVSLVIIVASTITIWLIASGDPENISHVLSAFAREKDDEDQLRTPERVPVKTGSGDIEIIEVCPPCPDPDCEIDCPCPSCLVQMPCPVCPTMKIAPIDDIADGGLLGRSP